MSEAADQGITVTEIAAMDEPIDVLRETTAAFVGRALRGPLNTPVLVRNFGEFRRRFGEIWPRSSLGPAAKQFFEHGGQRLYVVRVANDARGAMLCLPASGSAVVLRAVEPGSTEHIRAAVDYDGVGDNEDLFNLTLQRTNPDNGLVLDQELFRRLSYRASAENFVGDALLASKLARLEHPYPTHRPEATGAGSGQFGSSYINHAQAGSDGHELTDYDLVGSHTARTGLFALEDVESFDVLYLPPRGRGLETGPAAVLAADLYCRRRGALLIVDPLAEWSTAASAAAGIQDLGYASPNMLGYFPRVLEREGTSGARQAGGAIAGLLCKQDRTYGPWQSLSLQGMGLKRSLRPAVPVDDNDRRLLVRAGINVFAEGPAGRARLFGSVTLGRGSGLYHDYASLPVRRLCLHIVNAIAKATRWAVFEPDPARMVRRIRAQVVTYLHRLDELGAFVDQQFSVQCDAGVNKPIDGEQRGVTIRLVFHPITSEELVSLTLHLTAAGCRVVSTAFAPSTEMVVQTTTSDLT